MTAPHATCARCDTDLYPRTARRSDEGWVCAGRSSQPCATRVTTAERMAARAEDIRWMAATGENAVGAAERLGVTIGSLEQFCKRHDLRDELRRLRARDPRDHNASTAEAAVIAKPRRRAA